MVATLLLIVAVSLVVVTLVLIKLVADQRDEARRHQATLRRLEAEQRIDTITSATLTALQQTAARPWQRWMD